MSIESHLAELERRHAALEAELHEALLHPASTDIEVTTLKRRKLQLKDQILKIKGEATVH